MIEKVDFGDPLGALGALDDNNGLNCGTKCDEGCNAHNSQSVDSTYESIAG
jgi:hypothetical protein